MKQLGESIRSDAVNAQVITTEPGTSTGTVYYIAPEGLDGNDGKSPGTPWPIEKVNATTLKAKHHHLV